MCFRARCCAPLALLLSACGGSTSSPGNTTERLNGTERFGWTQPAADAGEITTFRYAFYVDDVRSEAMDVECTPDDGTGRFSCSAGLPSMRAGSHALQIAAFLIDAGVVRESSRSVAIQVLRQ